MRVVSFSFFFLLCALLDASPVSAQIHRLPLPRSAADTSFGGDVALDEGRALVGASGENTCGPNAGAAYIFERNTAGDWEKVARLIPRDCEPNAFFGRSISLSGNRVLIGASKEFFADERPNVAYVFERDSTGAWQETAHLTIDPRRAEGTFAASVSLDGDRALITSRGDITASASAPGGRGTAYIFERDSITGQWNRTARLLPSGDRFSNRLVFGGNGALDGRHVAVTASSYFAGQPGAIYLFEQRPSGNWKQMACLEGIDGFSIPLSLNSGRLLVGESRAGRQQEGAATLFRRTRDGTWEKAATLRPRTPYPQGSFGTAVSLQGARALVTGYDEQLGLQYNIDRVVYVFKGAGATWRQQQIIDIGEVSFGTAIDQSGGVAVISYVPDASAGAAYVVGLR